MPECIFCQIVKGEIPSYKVYEDEEFLGFLDISQIVDGHTLLIPKKHVRWVWDIEDLGEFYGVAKKIVKKMQQASGEEMVMTMTIGDMVAHAHLHLLPRTEGSIDMVLEAWVKAMKTRKLEPKEMEQIAERFKV
jgi:histidine triad (HIT) family protein